MKFQFTAIDAPGESWVVDYSLPENKGWLLDDPKHWHLGLGFLGFLVSSDKINCAYPQDNEAAELVRTYYESNC